MKKRVIVIIIIAVAAIGGAVFYFTLSTRDTVATLQKSKELINILVAGSNSFKERKHRFLAVVSVNPENGTTGITYIPPTLRVDIPGKQSSSLPIGNVSLDDFSLMRASLEKWLRLQIPFYIEVYAPDVERTVNLLEGISIFFLDQGTGMKKTIGTHYLDGLKVMDYINDVPENSLYIKQDRVQDIISTCYFSPAMRKVIKLPGFKNMVYSSIKTNMSRKEIQTLVNISLSGKRFLSTLLPGRTEKGFYIVDDIAYRIYKNNYLSRFVIFKKEENRILVRVLNGTNVPGLARKMRNSLIRDGLNVVEFGTSDFPLQEHTIIISRVGSIKEARAVSEIVGTDRIFHVVNSARTNNVLVIIGKDMIR